MAEVEFYAHGSDTQAPSVPTGLASSAITQTSFTLSWTASTDNVGVTGYEVFKNGTSVGTTTTTSLVLTGFTCATTYTMTVRANDAGFNWSAQSTALIVATSACGGYAANLGINFMVCTDYDFGYIFADVVKQGRHWFTPGGADPCPVDANGWPTGDDAAMIMFASGMPGVQGTYKLSFDASTPNVTLTNWYPDPNGYITFANKVYNNGHYTVDVNVSSAALGGPEFISPHFQNTGNGVRNVKCMMPGQQPGDVFSNNMLNAIDLFGTMRPTGMVDASMIHSVNWSDRRNALSPSQSNYPMPNDNLHYGVSYEYLIMLANQTHKDLWLNLPRLATDDYITKTAQLCKYGSDGVNPYTSTQSNPVFPPLDANLNLYTEFSNEIWNYNADNEKDLAVAEQNAGDPYHWNYDNSGNVYYWAFERTGYKAMHISNIFRSVFGDAQMPNTGNSRIRPVLAGQIDRYPVYLVGLQYIDHVWGAGNAYGNTPHPVNYYFYALSGAPYPVFNTTADNLTVDDIFAGLYNCLSGTGESGDGYNNFKMIDDLRTFSIQYGLKMVAYEGGQSLYKQGHSDAAKEAAQNDPRMKQFTKDLLNYWFSKTDGVFLYFTIGHASDWFALGNGYPDNNTQKWQALKEIAAKPSNVNITNNQPTHFSLYQNYPNPFNPTTTIEFSLAEKSRAILKVYNVLGQKVATLFDGEMQTGILYRVPFNASKLASGVYFYQLKTHNAMQIKKMILMK